MSNQMIILLNSYYISGPAAPSFSRVLKSIPHPPLWTVYMRETRASKSLYGYLAVL